MENEMGVKFVIPCVNYHQVEKAQLLDSHQSSFNPPVSHSAAWCRHLRLRRHHVHNHAHIRDRFPWAKPYNSPQRLPICTSDSSFDSPKFSQQASGQLFSNFLSVFEQWTLFQNRFVNTCKKYQFLPKSDDPEVEPEKNGWAYSPKSELNRFSTTSFTGMKNNNDNMNNSNNENDTS